jgi:hypothetical protein
MDDLENKIIDEQYKLIKEKYGEKAADAANYGWGVDCMRDAISVSTKVYGKGVLMSNGDKSGITHEWRLYT